MKTAAAVIATLLLGTAAQAQAPTAEAGQYRAALQRMITESAGGTCPADLMAEQLLTACQSQIANMSAGLQSLGEVQSVTFLRAETRPEGRVELYAVQYSGGQSLTWGIGAEQDGKFAIAFAGA